MANRKDVSALSGAALTKLRALLDEYIGSANDPVAEHAAAGQNMSLIIHSTGFLTWHQHFISELETWLANNGGGKFVPLPYWNPAKPIRAQLSKNNANVNMPLPANIRPAALKKVTNLQHAEQSHAPVSRRRAQCSRRTDARSADLAIGPDLLAVPRLSARRI